MHLYPRRWNVAAQVAEELKTVTYATPSYGGTQQKKGNKYWSVSGRNFADLEACVLVYEALRFLLVVLVVLLRPPVHQSAACVKLASGIVKGVRDLVPEDRTQRPVQDVGRQLQGIFVRL